MIEGDFTANSGPFLSLFPMWTPQAQLRAMLEVTQQQTTQAESQLQELQQRSSQIQRSACTLASVVSGKFSCLLQALEMRRAVALKDIEVAKTQALTQALDEEQRLQGRLEALACRDRRIRDLLEQLDDRTFLQVPGLRAAGWGPSVSAPCARAYCTSLWGSGISAPGTSGASRATDSSAVGRRSAVGWSEGVAQPVEWPPPGQGRPPPGAR